MGFITYRQGVKDGQQIDKGKSISPLIQSPVAVVKQAIIAKETEIKDKTIEQGIANLTGYYRYDIKNYEEMVTRCSAMMTMPKIINYF